MSCWSPSPCRMSPPSEPSTSTKAGKDSTVAQGWPGLNQAQANLSFHPRPALLKAPTWVLAIPSPLPGMLQRHSLLLLPSLPTPAARQGWKSQARQRGSSSRELGCAGFSVWEHGGAAVLFLGLLCLGKAHSGFRLPEKQTRACTSPDICPRQAAGRTCTSKFGNLMRVKCAFN